MGDVCDVCDDGILKVIEELRAISYPFTNGLFYYITDDGRWLCSENPHDIPELAEIFLINKFPITKTDAQ